MSTQEYLKNLNVPTHKVETKMGEQKIYEIDEPDALDKGTKNLIFDDFYPVALTAFNQNRSESFQEDVWQHLFSVQKLYLVFNEDVSYRQDTNSVARGIAFRAISEFQFKGKKIAYIEGTAVDPNYQGYGFYQAFTKLMGNSYNYVTSRTQNPVVLTALSKVFKKVNPFVSKPDKELQEIGAELARKLEMENYDKDTMIDVGFYGGPLSGLPPNIDNQVSRAMYSHIDRENGDCVIVVCSN